MHEFCYLKKIKTSLFVLNIIKYLFWSAFLYFQGLAIEQAIYNEILLKQIVTTLLYFALTKLIVMVCDVFRQFLTEYYKNKEIYTNWNNHFPQKIYKDNAEKSNLIYLKYFDYLPELFNIECNRINNISTLFVVFALVFGLLIYTGFYYGIMTLFFIFALNIVSKNLYLKKINICATKINTEKAKISKWLGEYFKAFRELYFNWNQQLESGVKEAYIEIYKVKKKYAVLLLFRDIASQIFVEIPFVFNTALVIVGVYCNYLNITQMFIWVGLSQFAIQAANAFLQNQVNTVRKQTIINSIEEINQQFKARKDFASAENEIYDDSFNFNKLLVADCKISSPKVLVKLQDACINTIGIAPGIYHIKGTNGSGKSTLLNTILGFERQLKVDNYNNLQNLLSSISREQIRVIERDAVLFSQFDFNQQILGPELAKITHYKAILALKLKYIFSKDLYTNLLTNFYILNSKFESSNHIFSSGEKVMISLMRAVASWDANVKILVIDECSVFLDSEVKKLFMRCVDELSRITAVYFTSHEKLRFQTNETSYIN